MSVFEAVAQVAMYALAWFVIGSGVAFILAAAFFGYPEDKKQPEEDNLTCPVTGGKHIITTIWSKKDKCSWKEKAKENQNDL